MGTFIVSFLVFAGAALLLQLGQTLRKGPLPVGCTPGSGDCCMAPGQDGRTCGKPGGCYEEKDGTLGKEQSAQQIQGARAK